MWCQSVLLYLSKKQIIFIFLRFLFLLFGCYLFRSIFDADFLSLDWLSFWFFFLANNKGTSSSLDSILVVVSTSSSLSLRRFANKSGECSLSFNTFSSVFSFVTSTSSSSSLRRRFGKKKGVCLTLSSDSPLFSESFLQQ